MTVDQVVHQILWTGPGWYKPFSSGVTFVRWRKVTAPDKECVYFITEPEFTQ